MPINPPPLQSSSAPVRCLAATATRRRSLTRWWYSQKRDGENSRLDARRLRETLQHNPRKQSAKPRILSSQLHQTSSPSCVQSAPRIAWSRSPCFRLVACPYRGAVLTRSTVDDGGGRRKERRWRDGTPIHFSPLPQFVHNFPPLSPMIVLLSAQI